MRAAPSGRTPTWACKCPPPFPRPRSAQLGNSGLYKLPGGKLKPGEDGEPPAASRGHPGGLHPLFIEQQTPAVPRLTSPSHTAPALLWPAAPRCAEVEGLRRKLVQYMSPEDAMLATRWEVRGCAAAARPRLRQGSREYWPVKIGAQAAALPPPPHTHTRPRPSDRRVRRHLVAPQL